MDGARRLAWLEDYASAVTAAADLEGPERLAEGIRFEHVSFTYPGSSKPALQDVNLLFPTGSVVAIVGENGAGKSTLAKLIAKLYSPTSGRILVDDLDLARLRAEEWQARLAGSFQDFFRFEISRWQTIGLGDLPRIEEEPALFMALERAGANDVVATMPSGLDTQLGKTWNDGIEVSSDSGRSWPWRGVHAGRASRRHPRRANRRLGRRERACPFRAVRLSGARLSRRGRADDPRVAPLQHAADGGPHRRSQRFRVVEVGTHEDLMAANGQYYCSCTGSGRRLPVDCASSRRRCGVRDLLLQLLVGHGRPMLFSFGTSPAAMIRSARGRIASTSSTARPPRVATRVQPTDR